MSELDVLRGLGDQIVPPPFDALRETARRRTRRARGRRGRGRRRGRRRSSSATAILVTDERRQRTCDPSSRPKRSHDPPADVRRGRRRSTTATGLSTRPAQVVELDVTDDGVVVRTDDGGIWFTDGDRSRAGRARWASPARRTTSRTALTPPPGASWSPAIPGRVRPGSSSHSPGQPELVVFDTRTRRGDQPSGARRGAGVVSHCWRR